MGIEIFLLANLVKLVYKENTNIPDKEEGFDHMNDAVGYLIDYVKPLTLKSPISDPQRWNIKGKHGLQQRRGTRYS